MTRKTKRGKIGARVFATILSVALSFSAMPFSLPATTVYAENLVEAEEPAETVETEETETVETESEETDASSAESSKEEVAETEEAASEETTEETTEEETEEVDTEVEEAEAETTENVEETEAATGMELFGEGATTASAASFDSLVDFSQDISEADGIKTTVRKWSFFGDLNTGGNPVPGDTIAGIVVGGGKGRVILDKGFDLNIKNNSTAETTGVIYLPIAEDTNVVTINIKPRDKENGRYVSIGSFDSKAVLVDNLDVQETQTITFKANLKDYVVDRAGDVEGRFIPLYSHGNFKTEFIELIETDAVTIVDVSGNLTGEGVEKVTGLKFKNTTTEEIISCDVVDGSYSVSLPNGFEYVVSVTGTFEYGIDETDNGNILDLTTGNEKTMTRDFALVPQDVITITGKVEIEKIENAKPVTAEDLVVTLVPAKTTLSSVDLELTKGEDDYNYTYTAIILPEEEYSVKLTNANDYECLQTVNETVGTEIDFVVTPKSLYTVSLIPVTHNMKSVATVTALTVKNLDDDYTYSFSGLKGKELDIELRDGLYEVTEITTTGSYEPVEHFEVDGVNTSDMMYLKDTSAKSSVVYKTTVTVGERGCDYTTIYDALDAIKRMNRSEGQRVTVLLKDEYYQEQVVVDVPDVTFKGDNAAGATISWYYGLGGEAYYSAYLNTAIDKNHLFYDEAHAVDKFESATIGQTPGNWGSTVNLKNTASGFRAENITFENSFNYYISEVEKADIASSGNILDRTQEGADPTLYKSKERACTMYNRGAENIEFYNCSFISSQDTLYTGDANEYSYYYNCTIEGTTDFICGDGNAVFDNCDLVLYGFSDKVIPNLVILASKGSATKGYLFNYCTIKADEGRSGIQTAESAYLGRPWGTSDEKVAFMNTILDGDLILEKGWTTMNTVPSLNRGLHEYGTRFVNGSKVDLSGRVAANIGSDQQGTADNYALDSAAGYGREDYLNPSWTPSYYGADYAEVNEQILRYNKLLANESAFENVTEKQLAALDKALSAITKGLLVKDQSKVDTMAQNLEKALDDIAGKEAKAPVSNLKSGAYTLSRVVTLTTETKEAQIYYTTDGTDPSAENGELYTEPLVVKESVTLKAVAVAEGYLNSEISVYEYEIIDPNAGQAGGTFVLEGTDVAAFSAGEKADGDSEKAGTDKFFTVMYSSKSKVDSSNKSWEDGYSSGQRFNFGGIATTSANGIKFTTRAAADVKVWWAEGGDDSRQITILNENGDTVAVTEGDRVKNTAYISKFRLEEAGSYILGNAINNNYIFKVEVVEESASAEKVYDLQTSALTAFSAGAKTDGASEKAGTDDYFTVQYSAKSKVDASNKTWEDGYSSGQRINFGGIASASMNSVKFTTSGPASVKVWWAQGGDDSRQITILNGSGAAVATTTGIWAKNAAYISTLEIADAGTYYLGSAINNNYIFRVSVTETAGAPEKPARGNWADVPAPYISDVTVNGGKIDVTVKAYINYNGGDNVVVVMKDEKDDEVASLKSAKEDETLNKVVSFEPTASGAYTFYATLNREGEEGKVSAETDPVTFVLPLTKPNITAVTNKGVDKEGNGKLEVNWTKVNEAKKYDVEIVKVSEEKEAATEEGQEEKTVTKETVLASATGITEREVVLGGLPVGEDVTVKVYAVRDDAKSDPAKKTAPVTGNNDRTWAFSSFGSNGSANDSATVNADGSISIKTPSSTKIVPASTDGLGYYYTKMDPSENFTLTAKLKVDKWPYDNGQEGFGLMVADAVGEHGYSEAFWNNSYQALATQIQYNWDPTAKDAAGNYVGGVTNVTSDSATIFQMKMRLGLGWIARNGVTLDQKLKVDNGQIKTPSGFTTASGTFETSVPSAIMAQLPGITSESTPAEVQNAFMHSTVKTKGSDAAASFGTFNIIDGSKAAKPCPETVVQIGDKTFTDISEMRYQIQRSNTGYVLRLLSTDAIGNESDLDIEYLTDEDGNRISYAGTYNGMSVVAVDGKVYSVLGQKIIYDENRNSLTMIDKKYIYLGMFSARKSAVTVEEYTLETVDPEVDYPVEARVYEPVDLNVQIISAETSNTSDYDLVFNANADGTLTVTKGDKIITTGMDVKSGKWATLGCKLDAGDNDFKLVFTPAAGYTPGEGKYLVISKEDPDAKSVTLEHTVEYKSLSGDKIYVAPGARGTGTEESPASIYDAVSFAAPGQKIILAGGTYNLGKNNGGSNKLIRIERGTDGTKNAMITMETDSKDLAEGNRAVLDFSGSTGTGSAFVLSGSYWHLKDFDVTGSKNGEKGLHIAGNHNIIERVNAYKNGNTGIEIAREGNVGRDLWPSDNQVINCTSYLNYDGGFEDADGFAAKITVGDNNKFVGCVSAYNADDGWDLFAKVQSGSIGVVTIENCVAYKNGYLLGSNNGAEYSVFTGSDAVEFEAGNGNGFKLGGDGLSGYHVLRNSYSFGNKANGIDSNSCPDVQVFNSVSYDNGTNLVLNNYASAVNSDYTVEGLVSIGGSKTKKDSISMLGTQVASKIYNSSNFFWNGSESVNAVDSSLKVTKDIFVNTNAASLGVDPANNKFVNRDDAGNIVFGGFLQLKDSDSIDESLKNAHKVIDAYLGAGADAQTGAGLVPEFVVLAKGVKVLNDVEANDLNGTTLPEGYTWVKGDTDATAYAGTSAEFGIVNKETGSTSVAVVSFVQVTGVELRATNDTKNGLFGQGELELEAVPVYSPSVDMDVENNLFRYSFADTKKMGLEETVSGNTIQLRRADNSKNGVASYVATLEYSLAGKAQKVTSAAYSFSTKADEISFSFVPNGVEQDAHGKLIVEQIGDQFRLDDAKVLGVGTDTRVQVALGDTGVLKYTNGVFTAIASGTTYITITSVADRTVQTAVMVQVKGKEFGLNVSSLNIDKAKNDGVTFMVSKLGNTALENVSVSKVLKANKEMADLKDMFEIRNVIGSIYSISVKADTDENGVETMEAPKIANGTYSLILKSGENEFEPVDLVISETKPTVTIKQTKSVNLFYKAGSAGNSGSVKATSKLAGVTLSVDGDSAYNLSANGGEYQIIMTNATQKSIDLGGKLNNSMKLVASFDGYKKAYNKTINFNVATQTVAPKYKLEMAGTALYTELGIKDTEIKVLNVTTGEYVMDAQVKLATSKPAYVTANKYFALDEEAGVYKLSTTKTGNAKISVIDPDFSKDPGTKFTTDREVILNAPLVINTGKPVVKIGNARINGQAEYAAYSQAIAKVTVTNTVDFTLRNLTLAGNDKRANSILPYLAYSFQKDTLGQPIIEVTFKDSAEKTLAKAIEDGTIKAGTYNFTANFAINKLEGKSAPFALTVATGANATATVKGNINPVDRADSYATVVPKINYMDGTVTGMYFKAAENLFDVQWDSTLGAAKVYAKENGIYRANGTYDVTPVFKVSTAYGVVEVEARPVKVRTAQTTLKLSKLPDIVVKMSDLGQEGMAVVTVTSPKNAAIASATQLSQSDKFNVRYDEKSGNIYVSVKDIKKVKANGTYNISVGVTPVGSGVGAKQQTFSITVKVIR